tara:strand:+ start:230 stop:598 length:369 start_codon:yes stop_codon:yes gene_type:complete
MADLKIPNLNKNSDKFLFKKKLSLRRKSKRKLFKESTLMLFLSISIIYFNYIIPNKIIIFNRFFNNLGRLIKSFLESLSYFYEICLALFIVISLVFALILIYGAFSRLMKIINRKSRQISFK